MDDPVNHPPHYTKGKIETIDIIQDVTNYYSPAEAYSVGCVIKYLSRAPHKGAFLQDLKKAQWYMNNLVKLVEKDAK